MKAIALLSAASVLFWAGLWWCLLRPTCFRCLQANCGTILAILGGCVLVVVVVYFEGDGK